MTRYLGGAPGARGKKGRRRGVCEESQVVPAWLSVRCWREKQPTREKVRGCPGPRAPRRHGRMDGWIDAQMCPYQNIPSTKGLHCTWRKRKTKKVHDFTGQSRQCSLGPNPNRRRPPCPLWLPRVGAGSRAWKGRRVAAAANPLCPSTSAAFRQERPMLAGCARPRGYWALDRHLGRNAGAGKLITDTCRFWANVGQKNPGHWSKPFRGGKPGSRK